MAVCTPVTAAPAAAPTVSCSVEYGGQTLRIDAQAGRDPLTVAPVEIGSYFLFRVTVRTAPRGHEQVRIDTYAHRDDNPVLIHQARYPFSPNAAQPRSSLPGGFTGLQSVYEPVRDGELQYWCEWRGTALAATTPPKPSTSP